jgi:hypothetical protein
MNLITHLVKTDIRRSRGLLLVWLLLLALQGLLASFGMNPGDRGAQVFFALISQYMPQLEMLFLVVFVSFVILGDPLVGTTGFWLTRPIPRSTLLQSKALFAAVVIVLPAVLVEAVVFAANGMTPHYIALVVPDIILEKLTLILVVASIAALTPTFGRFAIVAAAIVVALFAEELVASWMRFFTSGSQDLSLIRSRDVATCLWIIFGAGAVVAHQYLTRRTVRSIVAAVIVGAATIPAQHLWAWDFMAPAMPKNGVLPFDVSAVKIELEGNIFTQEIMTASGQGAPDKQIDGVIDAVGLPMSYPVQPKRIRPHLQLSDGAALPVREGVNLPLMIQAHAEAFESALGGIPVVNAAGPSFSTGLFLVDADTYGEYGDQPLTFSADFDCIAWKYAISAEMAVAKGARPDRGSVNLAITGVLRQADGVDIILREREPSLLIDRANRLRPYRDPGLGSRTVYVLCNKKRNEAVLQKGDSFRMGSFMLVGESRLVSRSVRLSFGPEPQVNRLTPDLNAEWLADAELVRLDLAPVQEFSTRLVVKNLRLNGKNGSKEHPAAAEAKPAPLPNIELPENATKEQVKEYINAVLITGQRRKKFKADDPQVGMLVKVGAQNLEALLEVRSTLGSGHSLYWYAGDALVGYLDAAIKQLARPEDKDLIIRALPSDHNLAEVVLEKGLQAEARETLITELSHKGEGLPPSWIEAVASLQDPATYPELKAYFVRGGNPQSTFAILRKLPGIKLADAVDEAWKKAKYNEWWASDMCGIAAEFGHADALQTAANILRTTPRDDYRSEAREALKKFTPASGDDAALLAWFDANRDKLVFDPQERKFIVKPE